MSYILIFDKVYSLQWYTINLYILILYNLSYNKLYNDKYYNTCGIIYIILYVVILCNMIITDILIFKYSIHKKIMMILTILYHITMSNVSTDKCNSILIP